MTDTPGKSSRRQKILEALAEQLESNPGERITTANLAKALGVSEAALYRHFPSKAKMFEALMEFAEESVFGLVNRIVGERRPLAETLEAIMAVVLGFSERNPGITRVVLGEALLGETERLRARSAKFFERLEVQFKQVLREASLGAPFGAMGNEATGAQVLLAVAEGRMHQFVRSGFRESPLQGWDAQWRMLQAAVVAAPGTQR